MSHSHVPCIVGVHGHSVAAEQKYDWGGWRERLQSSHLSARSIRVRRAKIGLALPGSAALAVITL